MIIFMEILKIHMKVKYCEVNIDINLRIANGAYNPRKVPTRGQNDIEHRTNYGKKTFCTMVKRFIIEYHIIYVLLIL
jgi:hypothetical protein